MGYFDPLDTPGFKVGVSFVILFFGARVVSRRPTAFGRVSISLAWGPWVGAALENFETNYFIKIIFL